MLFNPPPGQVETRATPWPWMTEPEPGVEPGPSPYEDAARTIVLYGLFLATSVATPAHTSPCPRGQGLVS